MGKEIEDSQFKSKLVREICSISSSRSIACIHGRKRPFIDWYLLLRVGEDAEIDVIRKQYRKLALLLHPDKNSHPKAEVAFKLVSEAYTCLSDESKRRAFNMERWNNFCTECKRMQHKSGNCSAEMQSRNNLQRLREVRERFREETRIIEKCVKAHKASREEFPVFNPSNYAFKEYPHHRTRNYKRPEDLRFLRATNMQNTGNRWKYDGSTGNSESLIFEIGSERTFRNLSACLSSKCKVH